ncbi:IWS1-like protein isoform A [Alligator mississippiensis]|uniref:IWS1-like protein isoform A n=1 Tax=Alligator mississippiensis TaxID=8496 RepID=A0A151NUZ3_ALLMI|nr:IWS1-like protein isoform A [Alligator mississippiensis]
MESDYYSGDQSDDGGATPVQDERDSGSEAEDDVNEQHSGSDNGSIEHHSENEHSDGEDDGPTREHHMTDSENEDISRQKDSDSENEEPSNHNASDSENEGTHGGKDSDSDIEDHPNQHESDSENEDAINHRASDSENEEPQKDHIHASDSENEEPPKHLASDSENEEPPKHLASDSENEEPQKVHASDSENEPPKHPASDSENEEPPKHTASDSENEDAPRRKQKIESDSDGENRREEAQNDSHHSDNEQAGERFHGSDSEEEGPKIRKIADSDEEEREEEKSVKRKTAVLSDSEDDEKTPAKKVRILSDVEESDSDTSEKSGKAKKSVVASDSEDEEEERKDSAGKKKEEKDLFGSDSESGNEQENLIADIFGESGDEEEEEFTGFNQEDLEEEKAEAEMKETVDDSDSDDNIKRGKHMDFMSDFDMMLQRKKNLSGKRRRNRDGGTFISDADDVVSAMIVKMNEAAEEDRQLNTQKKPALKKLTLLPTVVMHLKKQDLKETFIDSGVMSAIKEWLSPLPDRSLPALKIREELLKILQELPSVSQETLKHSGIGRAVMYLYKHPKESRPNKDMAGKLINEWSRPIFGLTSNYKGMTREEREQRDLEQMPQRRRLSSSGGQTPRRDLEKVLTGEEKALRPGDPGFCARARVPMPSNKDYVVRPKWNVEMESSRFQGTSKKGVSRLDKQMRKFTDIRKKSRSAHAVKISIEGNKMPFALYRNMIQKSDDGSCSFPGSRFLYLSHHRVPLMKKKEQSLDFFHLNRQNLDVFFQLSANC